MLDNSTSYFLVACNTSLSKFDIISLKPSDCTVGGTTDEAFFSRKLEEIDLFTTSFSDKRELLRNLYDGGKVSISDASLVIAFIKKNGEVGICDVLYNRDSKNIRDLILNKSKHKHQVVVERIINNFFDQLSCNEDYSIMVFEGLTDIDDCFLKLLKSEGCEGKTEGIRKCSPYALLRNIEESHARYQYYRSYSTNILETALFFGKYRDKLRNKISEAILHDSRQLSLFNFSLNPSIKSSPPPKEMLLSTDKYGDSDGFIVPHIPMKEKRKYVMETVENLLPNSFIMTGKSSAKFNDSFFSHHISEKEHMILQKELDSYCRLHFYLHNFYKSKLASGQQEGYLESSEERELSGDIISESKKINRYLYGHDESLKRAYMWCYTYNRCIDKKMADLRQDNNPYSRGVTYVKRNS